MSEFIERCRSEMTRAQLVEVIEEALPVLDAVVVLGAVDPSTDNPWTSLVTQGVRLRCGGDWEDPLARELLRAAGTLRDHALRVRRA